MESRNINNENLDVEFRQDYINIDSTVAISSEGFIFKIGDIVHHEGTEDKTETAKIKSFTINKNTNDVIANTDKGYARISFLYH